MLTLVEDAAHKSYDYIICGGGTAGLCLAARLSEDTETSVLVLEAGEANLNDAAILRPASYGSHFGQTAYDWGHKTVPQEHCNGNQFVWQRGKGLGGSSAINFLCWTKPSASDINDLERLGNPGWNWANYEKYSHKSEKFVYPDEATQSQNNMQLKDWRYGKEGPMMTAFPGKIIAAELDMQQTLLNAGIPVARDPLGGDNKGLFFAPNTLDPLTHTRSYSASAYYLPNAQRKNLIIAVSALVHKVVLEPGSQDELTATGVEVSASGKTYTIKANKEVILCTGGLKTPQILELSGVGNRGLLESLNIPVKLDLPSVGENVQEHMFSGMSWELNDDVSFDTLDILRDPKVAAEHLELHKVGQGAFTMGITGFAFVPLEKLSTRADDIHSAVKAKIEKNSASYAPGLLEQYKIMLGRLDARAPGCELISFPGFLSHPNPPKPNAKYMTMLFALNHTFSRGTIHCTTNKPTDDPAFDPRYFSEECDLQTFVEIARFVRKLADIEPLKSMVKAETNPGPNVVDDQQLAEWLKNNLTTTYHTAGAASMLPKDKGGVVNSELKVYGTSNLRVVDLSILPLHFAAHPVASVYAFAEQAADIIRGKFKL